VRPGREYGIDIAMMPYDYLLPAGHRLAFVVLSSDHDYTLRPRPGAGLTIHLAGTRLVLPVLGGQRALTAAFAG
jgi:X-Pro dipeptidyl-peptidase